MEGEDLSGWLIPNELAIEFEEIWSSEDKNEIDTKWQKYTKLAQWENIQDIITITYVPFKMKDWEMFSYLFCEEPDEVFFLNQCEAIENNIPGLRKRELIIEEDNSKVQEYYLGDEQLIVYNSYENNSVYIESDFDIDPYFKQLESEE